MGQKHSPMSKDVDMSGRAMKHLQPAVAVPTFQRLAVVDLHDNNLHEIDEPIPAQLREKPPICETLTDLDLSQNKLRVLPDEICNLVALVRLKLDRNRLESLPLLFSQLFKLEKLTVSYNFLRSLPPNMGAMKNLRTLRVDHNQLTYIPNDIGDLPAVKELTIHENPLAIDVLELGDLDGVLSYFRSQPIPSEYKKLIKALKKALSKVPEPVAKTSDVRGEKLEIFKAFLADAKAKESFLRHMTKEHAQENLLFYLEVEDFRNKYPSPTEVTTQTLITDAERIYEKFLSDKAELEVNLPDDVRKRVVGIYSDSYKYPAGVNQWVFNECQASILKLMFTDTLKRYEQSAEGKEQWARVEAREKK
eukprot:TRINITY_DN271_c0_g1_i3.p1 TRINITY_DN271_c0_g1~~TRINITY_DN271_c0_g1_i3.p1  ORF type:complete len:363 (+),score=103.98 TRINITY_DN271_c0_g1_i3:197-1285(+)